VIAGFQVGGRWLINQENIGLGFWFWAGFWVWSSINESYGQAKYDLEIHI
jgi:hypothetical protein